ncbi:serine/threonine-protein kinase pim-2-like [Astyanax mexicanus]|uniref:Serine/threonine-protein kinase n=1 Tax=Astyanax mexicanus TaxID=7994 RepID=A0A8T2L4Q6_ASTMX|nr:serine/threonine-protein kinase pim-2-like [Astyanax mexicanus]
MMEGSIPRQGKRNREDEEEDFQRKESQERKRQKGEIKRRPRKQRRPMKITAIKPETFESLYTVGEKLGVGACGTVFAGTRVSDGLQVAIKFVQKLQIDRYVQSSVDSRSIPIEVALIKKMSEPPVRNIIQLIQWFDEPERYIVVMELFRPCMDLFDFVHRDRESLSEEMARHIMVQAIEAATECHKRGVLHRDIKLENFLINTNTFEIKMIDFGCGDFFTESEFDHFIGTEKFCPPEFILSGSYHATPLTVWSLGVFLFIMVNGFYPFTTTQDIIDGNLHFQDHLSHEICDLIRWCLQEDPTWRPSLQQIFRHPWFEWSV